jgi:hypothetical protein
MKKTDDKRRKRVLGRRLAREMTPEELKAVTGGTISMTAGYPGDCDQEFQN